MIGSIPLLVDLILLGKYQVVNASFRHDIKHRFSRVPIDELLWYTMGILRD